MKAVLKVEGAESKKRKRCEDDRQRLEDLLQRHFGHPSFRGLQLEAIQTVLSGGDCFCLMPTGAGKSICYEIPALARPGIVLVVSPLIALMEDQVSALKSRKIRAEFLSSTQSTQTKNKIHAELDSGKPSLRLLYVTPELISTNAFMKKLKSLHGRGLLTLIAIDEAHCISSWGHDFRPSYGKLSSLRSSLPDVPILALTATASRKVQQDVVKSLNLQKPALLISSFNRPNIFYEVRYKDLLKSSYEDLRDTLARAPTECSIIYCHSRATCDEIGARLKTDDISCRVYHAGINDKLRSEALRDWTSGKVPVIVATVAFGMGIDRKDVRLVCHFNMPKSLESFYQESGRAGRDGKSSKSIMYYSIDDRKTMEFVIRSSFEKQKARKDGEGNATNLLKKNVEAFQSVVSYCEKAFCRRHKVLEHFGEQVSPFLCGKTCDVCKWPERVSASLRDLGDVSSEKNFRGPYIRIQNNTSAEKSEFWSYENEDGDESEEGISSSDDEENQLARAAASKGGKKVEQRLDALLRAEQDYCAKQGIKHEKTAQRVGVSEEYRSSTRARLTSSLQAAAERLGITDIVVEAASATLEGECYAKYGKTGKTFYNSQVASTVRWLSNCATDELQRRLKPAVV